MDSGNTFATTSSERSFKNRPTFSDCQALIRWQLNRLITSGSLSREELQDLEQEISLHALKKLGQYDPRQGSLSTYLSTVVSRKFIDCWRSQWKQSRWPQSGINSIDCAGISDRGSAIRNVLSGEDLRRHRGVPGSRKDLTELQLDVHACVAELPPELQETCRLLALHSVAEAASELAVSRSTLYEQIRHIRSRFTDASLDAYL